MSVAFPMLRPELRCGGRSTKIRPCFALSSSAPMLRPELRVQVESAHCINENSDSGTGDVENTHRPTTSLVRCFFWPLAQKNNTTTPQATSVPMFGAKLGLLGQTFATHGQIVLTPAKIGRTQAGGGPTFGWPLGRGEASCAPAPRQCHEHFCSSRDDWWAHSAADRATWRSPYFLAVFRNCPSQHFGPIRPDVASSVGMGHTRSPTGPRSGRPARTP